MKESITQAHTSPNHITIYSYSNNVVICVTNERLHLGIGGMREREREREGGRIGVTSEDCCSRPVALLKLLEYVCLDDFSFRMMRDLLGLVDICLLERASLGMLCRQKLEEKSWNENFRLYHQ